MCVCVCVCVRVCTYMHVYVYIVYFSCSPCMYVHTYVRIFHTVHMHMYCMYECWFKFVLACIHQLAVAIDAENRRLSSPGWMDQNKQRGAEETEETLAEDGPHQKTAWSPRHRVFLDFSSVKSVRTDRETVRKMKTRGKVCTVWGFVWNKTGKNRQN